MRVNKLVPPVTAILFLFVLLVSALAPVSAYGGASNRTRTSPNVVLSFCRDCQAGYSISGSSGMYTSVSANFVIPKISCNYSVAKSYGAQFSIFGVFIDGYNSNDVASAYVRAECRPIGSSEVELSLTPLESVNLTGTNLTGSSPSWSPNVGDKIQFMISERSGAYTIVITDVTQSRTFKTTGLGSHGAALDSAMCAVTFATNGGTHVFPSVSYAPFRFKACWVGGPGLKRAPIGTDPGAGTLTQWISVSSSGALTLATAWALTARGGTFRVQWNDYGP